jgi:hypothetical protein
MDVGLTTVNVDADMPPKVTIEAPVKLVPVIVTVCPVQAVAGVKLVTVGGTARIKPANAAVPTGVVTLTLPLVPDATTAVIVVGFTYEKEVAAVPPNVTAVTPVKLVPVMVTVAPDNTAVGENEVITGKFC